MFPCPVLTRDESVLRVTRTLAFANPRVVLKIMVAFEQVKNSSSWEMPPYKLKTPVVCPGMKAFTVFALVARTFWGISCEQAPFARVVLAVTSNTQHGSQMTTSSE